MRPSPTHILSSLLLRHSATLLFARGVKLCLSSLALLACPRGLPAFRLLLSADVTFPSS